MSKADHVIERMRLAVGAKHDADLARALGRAKTTVSGWRKRESIPLDVFVRIAEQSGRSLDWLVLGHAAGNPMTNELRTLRQSKVDAEAALDAARTLTKEARQALAAAQREEKEALGRFEAARLAWIEAAEAHYGAP